MRMLQIPAAAMAAFLVLAGTAVGWAASPAEIAAQRREILDALATTDPAPAVAAQRWVCAMGKEPAMVAKSRGEGADFFPDASDSCVAALTRVARDLQLSVLYDKLLTELSGNRDGAGDLPRAIGGAVLNGAVKVPIGNGKAATVTPALAFDAGFAVAFQQGAANSGVIENRQLKAMTEACLGQQQDPATCFSVGHVHGARAFAARTASVR